MAADPLACYRLVAPDIDILDAMVDRLSTGSMAESEQIKMARELRKLIDRAKENPYRDTPDWPTGLAKE
jgi:hypothetical protein